jgi:cysteine desulfurase / selenocysteine lyase
MGNPIIYFDNAATSYPKPEEVYRAQDIEFRMAGSPGRGAHSLAYRSAFTVYENRQTIATFLGAKKVERLIFTPGCTYSLNMVLKGLAEGGRKAFLQKGDVILISSLEHNAVMRPLTQIANRLELKISPLRYRPGVFGDLRDFQQALKEVKPKLVILTEGSNITGEVLDLHVAAGLCKEANVPLLVDAAQTAGRFPECLANEGISFWCASAHKGLMGPPGLGLLYVNANIELEPLIAGGTGSASERLEMPEVYPDHLESGTIPSQAIAGLRAGVDWLEKTGSTKIHAHEGQLVQRFLTWCADQPFVQIYGFFKRGEKAGVDYRAALESAHTRIPIVSFRLANKTPDQVADLLDRDSNIAVRAGLQCCVQGHRALGTVDKGLVRVSFGMFNTLDEVDTLCTALETILHSS